MLYFIPISSCQAVLMGSRVSVFLLWSTYSGGTRTYCNCFDRKILQRIVMRYASPLLFDIPLRCIQMIVKCNYSYVHLMLQRRAREIGKQFAHFSFHNRKWAVSCASCNNIKMYMDLTPAKAVRKKLMRRSVFLKMNIPIFFSRRARCGIWFYFLLNILSIELLWCTACSSGIIRLLLSVLLRIPTSLTDVSSSLVIYANFSDLKACYWYSFA